MESLSSIQEVAQRYKRADQLLGLRDFEATPPIDRDRSLTALEKSRLAQAIAIAEDLDRYPHIRPATVDFVQTQNRTKASESIGAPFINPITLRFSNGHLLDQKLDEVLPSMRTAAIGARAMAACDSGYNFYAKRTSLEYAHLYDVEEMMGDSKIPVGTVSVLASACETDQIRHAKSIGMFPSRTMAVLQYARKASNDRLELMAVSLDQADLDLLGRLLARHGRQLPNGIRAEDTLAFPFAAQAFTTDEFKALIQNDINWFDQTLMKERGQQTRQGQLIDDKGNPKGVPWDELGEVLEAQFQFDEALSWAARKEPRVLHPLLRQQAETALRTIRPDGRPLLNVSEQSKLRGLLEATAIHISNIAHADAFLILKNIQDTGMDELIRRYIAGDHQVVEVVQSPGSLSMQIYAFNKRGQVRAGVSEVQTQMLMKVTAEAAQAGRFSGACGSLATFGEGAPQSLFDPARLSSVVGQILRGEDTSWLVANDAPLVVKYGRENVHLGVCDCCEDEEEVGPCSVCNTCDTRDRQEPGFIERTKAIRKAREAVAVANK